jgi:hypothetical protein
MFVFQTVNNPIEQRHFTSKNRGQIRHPDTCTSVAAFPSLTTIGPGWDLP